MKSIYRHIFILLMFIFTLGLSACQKEEKEVLHLSLPYEMHFVAPKLVEAYEKNHPKIQIEIHELASSELADSEKQGLYILDSWAEFGTTSKPFLSNPILVIGKRKLYQLDELKGFSIAISDPDFHSSGVAAIKILREAGLWDLFKRNISYQKRGINSIQAVDLQENDYGIVSASDSIYLKNSFVVLDLASYSDSTIQYRIQNYEKKSEDYQQLADFLHSPKALSLFTKYGFVVPKLDSAKSEPQT